MLKYCKTHDVIKLIVVERKFFANRDDICTDTWIYLQIYNVARVSKSQSCAHVKAELLWIFENLSYKRPTINKRRYWWPLRDGKLINCPTRKVVCRLPISARNNGLSAKTNSFQFLLISATSSSLLIALGLLRVHGWRNARVLSVQLAPRQDLLRDIPARIFHRQKQVLWRIEFL